jgi:hypothetical protein
MGIDMGMNPYLGKKMPGVDYVYESVLGGIFGIVRNNNFKYKMGISKKE